jgi:threonine dehydrogenase-like Zn-dependent dehydrogenase
MIRRKGRGVTQSRYGPRLTSLIITGKFPVEKKINSRIQVSDVVEQGFEKLTTKSNNALKILVRSD